MASIPGGVRIGGFVSPTDSTDTYPTHDSTYGKGGHREVADNTERDAISTARRREGMTVYVVSTGLEYRLVGGVANGNWVEVTAGGGGTVTVGDTTSINLSIAADNITADAIFGTTTGTIAEGNHNHNADYAPAAKGVTNGDSHDHSGGDGAQIAYSSLSSIPTTFTPASHTHGNVTNAGYLGVTAAIPLITGTGGIIQAGTFGTLSGTFCQGNDSRLSDARTPTTHTHGGISNTGAIGTTATLPIITGASGVLQAGSFGSTAGTFCQGNDARLSDSRTPTAHTTGSHSDWPVGVTMTEIGYLDGVTSSIQTQFGAINTALGDIAAALTAINGV